MVLIWSRAKLPPSHYVILVATHVYMSVGAELTLEMQSDFLAKIFCERMATKTHILPTTGALHMFHQAWIRSSVLQHFADTWLHRSAGASLRFVWMVVSALSGLLPFPHT